MKWIPILILTAIFSNDPVDIARINGLKKQAEETFLNENYPAAIDYYHTLIDSLGATDDELYLNLAHAYYESGDSAQSRTYYSQASTASQSEIKSIAYQQLGALAKDGQQLEESLNYLKASIKADPSNQDARYDYELVKKLLKQQQDQQQNQDQQNQDQENQDQQNEENQENQDQQNQDQQNQENQEGENQDQEQDDQQQQNPDEEQKDQEGEEQEQQQEGEEQQEEQQQDPKDMSTQEKLEEMNISQEKAQMILEAMRNSEIQYLQQQKRKPTKRPETGKPDW